MKPGYYVVTRDHGTSAAKAGYRLRLHKGDWLVTDGYSIGRFDRTELDWLPLEWIRNLPVVLDQAVDFELSGVAAPINPKKLEAGFHQLVFIEPGEPLPDLPRPPLSQLEPYLRSRRGSVEAFFTYDRRP